MGVPRWERSVYSWVSGSDGSEWIGRPERAEGQKKTRAAQRYKAVKRDKRNVGEQET